MVSTAGTAAHCVSGLSLPQIALRVSGRGRLHGGGQLTWHVAMTAILTPHPSSYATLCPQPSGDAVRLPLGGHPGRRGSYVQQVAPRKPFPKTWMQSCS